MGSVGFDRRFRLVRDFDHVVLCVAEMFGTMAAERVMRRWLYAGLPSLLGRRITERRIALYLQLVQLAIDTWEKRLQVVRVSVIDPTVEAVRMGELEFEILVYYRPNGHRGDFTVEGGLRRLGLAANDNVLVLRDLDAAA